MNKFSKKLLVGIITLGLIVPMSGTFTNNANASHYSFSPHNKLVEHAIRYGHTQGSAHVYYLYYKGFTFKCVPRYSHGHLRPGSVIVSLNGNRHASTRQVIAALHGHRIGYHHYRKSRRYTHHRSKLYYIYYHGHLEGWSYSRRSYDHIESMIHKAMMARNHREAIRQIKQSAKNKDSQVSSGSSVSSSGNDYKLMNTSKNQQATESNLHTIANQISARTLQDINNERIANGLRPYIESQELNNVAQVRADQHTVSHYNADGQIENGIVAKQLGYHPYSGYYGENLGGNYLSTPQYGNQTINNETGIKAADWNNDNMMNYDQASNYGHRKNILNTYVPKVGVGASCYIGANGTPAFNIAEEFGY